MMAYKIEILIIDHDEVGEEIIEIIENTRYPNRCIHPYVMQIQARDVGEWTDDHPLNSSQSDDAYYKKIFE